MRRINLYNYRYQEQRYKKLRLYFFLLLTIILAILINIFIFSYYQIKIIRQESSNEFLVANINLVNKQLQPIYDYRRKVNLLNQQIKLLNQIENTRDNMVAFIQKITKVTPQQVYYSQIILADNMSIIFKGVATSPLYLAALLDKLKSESNTFYEPSLKANNMLDNDHYSFIIATSLKENLFAESYSQN